MTGPAVAARPTWPVLGHNARWTATVASAMTLSVMQLLLEPTQAKADGSYHKQLKQLASIELLVIR